MILLERLDHPCIDASGMDRETAYSTARAGRLPPLGQYAYAWMSGNEIRLLRDPIGLNKLFFGVRGDGTLVAASRIFDLLDQGIELDSIASCPPGHATSFRDGKLDAIGGFDLSSMEEDPFFDLNAFKKRVRSRLIGYFDYLQNRFSGAQFVVCLSGGLDSTAVAALAKERLEFVTAACFSFLPSPEFGAWLRGKPIDEISGLSDDFCTARDVARELDLRLIPIFRPTEAVAPAIRTALRLCQDWRDFNVHCSVVNLFLAQDIRPHFPSGNAVVLTGDLMNEFVCDYHEERFDGAVYYPQPRIPLRQRRRFFLRGLDAGDREIGIFNGYGLPVCQPFAAVAEDYLGVPAALLSADDAKLTLNGHLIPDRLLSRVGRVKQRAQVGGVDGGTLGVFHRLGLKMDDLFRLWVSEIPSALRGDRPQDIIQYGRYRTTVRAN